MIPVSYGDGVQERIQQAADRVDAFIDTHGGYVPLALELGVQPARIDTIVDFDHSLGTAINKIREALGDSAENPLFVETLDYEFRALDEQAIAAFYCGFPDEAFDLCTELLDHRALPDADRPRIEATKELAMAMLSTPCAGVISTPARFRKSSVTRRKTVALRDPLMTISPTNA